MVLAKLTFQNCCDTLQTHKMRCKDAFCHRRRWSMRSRLRGVVFCFILLFFLNTATAVFGRDAGRISGNVKSISGSPLSDAVIRIIKSAAQGETLLFTRSDQFGSFLKANLAPGTYYVQVLHHGYEPVTTGKFAVDSGRTAALDIVLQDFIDFVSKDDDPRNWDVKTVMRSSSERRMIFRNLPEESETESKPEDALFDRSGAVRLASTTLNNTNYLIRPQTGQSGISSNFAFAEPINQNSRMIISGQADFGYNPFWRLRNTYNYRPDNDHDYRISVGYGRIIGGYPGASDMPSKLLPQESNQLESGLQTLAFSMEGTTKFLDMMSIRYGIDYSRLHYTENRSFTYPSIQILITPFDGWNIKTSLSSHRVSNTNSVILPNGEGLDLSEPALITMVGNQVNMSQVRHSEVSAERTLGSDTAIELAIYQDQTRGPGLPIMVTAITPEKRRSNLIELNEDGSSQQGTRLTISRNFFDFLSGSIAYVYGEATQISNIDPVSSDQINSDFLKKFARQRYHHAITGKIDGNLQATKTSMLATFRWYPENPVTPVDWFSDRMDIGTKSVNFEIHQVIPFPNFLGYQGGRWEVLIDLRNMLNQGKEAMPISNGEIVLNRNPRSLRFGLSLNFR
jgi:hypothetical protein